jgi:thiamine biosynthesis protein ThiC
MTNMQLAKKKKIIPDFEQLSKIEQIEIDEIVKGVASGRIVIYPSRFNSKIVGIGYGLRSKAFFNFGYLFRIYIY